MARKKEEKKDPRKSKFNISPQKIKRIIKIKKV